jgi:hypothetical protein
MPKKTDTALPKTMTWGRAAPVLALCFVFDALRFIFEMFWFFGPALAAFACTLGVNSTIGTTVASVAGKLVGAACGAAATAGGILGAEVIAPFGIVMAMAVGFAGWIAIGLITLMTNARMLQEERMNILWFMGSLATSEVPFIGALPALTITMVRLYHAQIKKEKAVLKKHLKQQAAEQVRDRQQQAAQLAEARGQEVAQYEQYDAEAANDEQYEETEGTERKPAYTIRPEAANDDSYEPSSEEEIPQDTRKAA